MSFSFLMYVRFAVILRHSVIEFVAFVHHSENLQLFQKYSGRPGNQIDSQLTILQFEWPDLSMSFGN